MMQELNYIRCGDYYIPDIRLPEENRPIGRWGRMHRDYIKEHNPTGENVLDRHGHLIVDHDLYSHDGLTPDGIAEAFIEFAKKEGLSFFQ